MVVFPLLFISVSDEFSQPVADVHGVFWTTEGKLAECPVAVWGDGRAVSGPLWRLICGAVNLPANEFRRD